MAKKAPLVTSLWHKRIGHLLPLSGPTSKEIKSDGRILTKLTTNENKNEQWKLITKSRELDLIVLNL